MEIKDQTIETATDAEGNEYIAEMEATMTETEADGTETVTEMTATADPDDPTDVEGHMTVTEIAPDGTETVTEYVANEEGVFRVEEESVFEQAAEAILGVEIGDDLTQVMDEHGNLVGEEAENAEITADETDSDYTSIEFNLGDDEFGQSSENFEISDTQVSDESFEPTMETIEPTMTADAPSFDPLIAEDATFDPNEEISGIGATTDVYSETDRTEEENQEVAEQQARAEAATEAQQAADDFVAEGDYAAAAEAREVAENEAWEAGDDSMLGGYDSIDLKTAAGKQEDAEYYQQQQAIHAQEGDYEAAREDAQNAAYATGDADYYAGGEDHTGQADSDVQNLDNAVWHEGLAEDRLEDAAYHAEMGNEIASDSALDAAGWEQSVADDFGDKGEPGNIMNDYDPSSEVATGGSYESTFDDNLADVDTGFDPSAGAGYDAGTNMMETGYDAGADMSVDTGFDAGVDTTMDTGYDPGMDDV